MHFTCLHVHLHPFYHLFPLLGLYDRIDRLLNPKDANGVDFCLRGFCGKRFCVRLCNPLRSQSEPLHPNQVDVILLTLHSVSTLLAGPLSIASAVASPSTSFLLYVDAFSPAVWTTPPCGKKLLQKFGH